MKPRPYQKPHKEPDADDRGGKPDGDMDDKQPKTASARRQLAERIVKGMRK